MPWLTRKHFIESHVELGSGTCLQPLLRFSDRFDQFLFVDFDPAPENIERHLRSSVEHLARAAQATGCPAPLVLHDMHTSSRLDVDDFELIGSPRLVLSRAAQALGNDIHLLGGFAGATRASGARQWGVHCGLSRPIVHVDGSVHQRRLTLRIVGGEGLLTWIGMGGLDHAPRSVGTVQTGLGERHNGPLARLFASQSQIGAALPDVWVRGQEPFRTHQALKPAPPFDVKGMAFSGWVSDRHFDMTGDRRREVAAWVRSVEPRAPILIGAHVLDPTALDRAAVNGSDAACLPRHLAQILKVEHAPNLMVVEHTSRELLLPLANQLRTWAAMPAFRSARDAVLVPFCFEDELIVLVQWLRELQGPAVHVHLPMALDFLSARRAVQIAGSDLADP